MSMPTTDKLLESLGLEPRRSTVDVLLPAMGYIAIGVVVGAGVALLFAPKSGREVRDDISRKVSSLRRQATSAMDGLDDSADA